MCRTTMLMLILVFISSIASASSRVIEHEDVLVGNYRLSFNYISGSKPAIVFESGSGVKASHWNKIMKTLSSKLDNTIISYDRAGYGKSDLPAEPYKIENEILWLRKGLEHLGYADSIIYIGHSYGYYLLKMYEAKYRKSIRAMIYIDPVTIDFIDSMGGIEEELKHFDPSRVPKNKFDKALIRESIGYPDTFSKVKSLKEFGSTPCFVISAEKPGWSSAKEVFEWKSGHEKLSERCGSEIIIAKGSGHDVPTDAPKVIVNKLSSITGLE